MEKRIAETQTPRAATIQARLNASISNIISPIKRGWGRYFRIRYSQAQKATAQIIPIAHIFQIARSIFSSSGVVEPSLLIHGFGVGFV